MVNDQPPQRLDPPEQMSGAGHGWTAVAYLLTGILVWGFVGWLVDGWLDTGGIAAAVGSIMGAAGGVYLTARRLGV